MGRDDALRALRWNPLDVRAQERMPTTTLDLDLARARASLIPGYWQPSFGLDAALVRLDMPELAIAALRQ